MYYRQLTTPVLIGVMALSFALVSKSAAQSRPKSTVRGVDAPTVIKPNQPVKQYPKCTRDHPGRTRRAESLAKQGDSRMGLSAARHAVRYAIERYGIKDLVSDTSLARADKDVYEFLKWKTGSASLLAAQWLSAGYQHFDAYAAEAGVSLMGTDLPGPKNHLILPKELTAWIMEQTDSAAKATNAEICGALFRDDGIEGGVTPTTAGTGGSTEPAEGNLINTLGGIACPAVIELARQATKRVYARLGIEGGMFESWEGIKDAEVRVQEKLRRNPPAAASTATAATSVPGSEDQSKLPTAIQTPGRVPPRR